MLLHYLGKLKNRNCALFLQVKHVANVTLLFITYPTDICEMSWKYLYLQRLTLCEYQHFTVRSFTVLSKLKVLQLSKVGLSTIKHQHCKNLTPWADATWIKNTWKCKLFAWVCSQNVFKMSVICTDTCLEMLSPLANCIVHNVSRHASVQTVFEFSRQYSNILKVWVLLEIYLSLHQRRNFVDRSRIDTVRPWLGWLTFSTHGVHESIIYRSQFVYLRPLRVSCWRHRWRSSMT